MKEYIIDVKDRQLGRAASEVALILRGKKEASFAPNRVPDIKVKVINVDKIRIGAKKMAQKQYKRYSGYPGGLKLSSMEKILKEKGMDYILKKTVMGMLPKNKLQKKMMENLLISNE